jgi:tetratricopeptide (TPR) repeat protein
VDEERDYYGRLTALAMGNFEHDALVRVGSILHAWLKSRRFAVEVPDYYGPNAERTAAYDYVLVDSRTGVTETGGLCIGPLSDQLVVLTALNDQNVEGTRRFLEEVGILAKRPSTPTEDGAGGNDAALRLDPKPTLIVASPVPAGETKKKRDRLQQLEAAVGKAVVKLSYHPQMALLESIFTRDYRDEYLADEYEALVGHVLRMANDGQDFKTLMDKAYGASTSPASVREAARQMARSAFEPGMVPFLRGVLTKLDVQDLTDDADFILWDRVFRVLTSGEEPTWFEDVNIWANLLTQWSIRSTQPEVATLRREAGMRCYGQVLQGVGASSRHKAQALVNRGASYWTAGDSEKAITDYTAVLQMPDAPAEQRAQALVNRSGSYWKAGDSEKAIADCTAVLQMPDAPVEQKAKALARPRLGISRHWPDP